ncbi:DUF3558 domain-containing protein [Amycolatopsis sp. EV170708-02-1]|uniref:DUF3558 domain-containing protein n=1 Tax=Amycolatopsis sp. EV170708-02-1 TaxID=2919322 RepID=UPI001F0BF34D|nr:DUF3558 domain-containing protein [Amycolatopsis sp. EV170708-02-1]UMP02861.1 DUF3558 domain-containing protein [Amycolatopsis sp. EV170708-02-1]
MATGTLLLSACDGDRTNPGTPTPGASASSSSAGVPNNGAPAVQNPLPAKVLDGSPCDSALTPQQLETFIGEPSPGKPSTDALGAACRWSSASGSGAGFTISYQTKSDQGISLPYKNVKPNAARWVELEPIDGYPAIGYTNIQDDNGCAVVVGVSDQLAYSVSLSLGDKAAQQGKDGCALGRDVASEVLKNLKGRA